MHLLGVQWFSGIVCLTEDGGVADSSLTLCPCAEHMAQLPRLKVKVTVKIMSVTLQFVYPLYLLNPLKDFLCYSQ